MKIKYLGTAAAEGWPALFCHCDSCKRAKALGGKNLRTRSQAVIDDSLLVDFPPDTYMHMLRDDLDLPNIESVLITHTHQDHLYPDDLSYRCGDNAHGLQTVLTLYGNDTLLKKYQAYMKENEFRQGLSDVLCCKEVQPFVTLQIGKHKVTPLLATHDKKEKCLIYLIESEGKSLLYGNDTGIFPEETWEFLGSKKLELVSLDCTMVKYGCGKNHMGINDVLETIDRLKKQGCIYSETKLVITHFSHNGILLHDEIEAAVSQYGIITAYDGMEISF